MWILPYRIIGSTFTKERPMHIHYMMDAYNGSYRIWQSTDPGDTFDMCPIAEFPLAFVMKYPHIFVEGYPEDDAGELECERCKLERTSKPMPKKVLRRIA